MIDQIFIQNFQGKTGRWTLHELTCITGPNGAGKSTIIKAAQLLLIGTVPGDSVNDTVGDQYKAYCSEEGGVMSIELSSERGVLSREWRKTKGRVSTQATFNGADIPAKTDFADLLGVKVFDLSSYWSLTPSKQVSVLCALAGVNPKDLDRLDSELELANTEKRNLMDKHKEAQQALKDHEAELQDIKEASRLESINPSTVESEIAELQKKADRLSKTIRDEQEGQVQLKADRERLADLQQRSLEIGEEIQSLNVPMADESPESLERELAAMEFARDLVATIRREKERIEKLRAIREPMPPAYKVEDINALQEMIVSAEQGHGVDKTAVMGYKIANKIFKAVQKLPYECEPDRKMVKDAIREACAEYKQAKEAQEKMSPLEHVADLRRQQSNMQQTRAKYESDRRYWCDCQQEAKEIEQHVLEESERAEAFDEAAYNRLRDRLATIKVNAESRSISIEKRDRLTSTMEAMIEEMDALRAKLPDEEMFVSVDRLIEERDEALAAIGPLRSDLQAVIKWKTIREIADKKEDEIDRLSKDLSKAKDLESSLQAQKASFLKTVQDKLSDGADRILSPDRLTFELPRTSKSTDRISFLLHKPNGDVVERGTLSGWERAAYDIALAHAIVGSDGVVVAEIAEIETKNVSKLIESLSKSSGNAPQTILVGHSLEWVDQTCQGIDMIYIEPTGQRRRSA